MIKELDKDMTLENFLKDNNEGMVLVSAYADWCGPCQMQKPLIDNLVKEVENLKVVRINIDEKPELVKELGVQSIPAQFLVRDGELLTDKIVGFKPLGALVAWVGRNEVKENK